MFTKIGYFNIKIIPCFLCLFLYSVCFMFFFVEVGDLIICQWPTLSTVAMEIELTLWGFRSVYSRRRFCPGIVPWPRAKLPDLNCCHSIQNSLCSWHDRKSDGVTILRTTDPCLYSLVIVSLPNGAARVTCKTKLYDMYVCVFFNLHFWRVTHRTHQLELLYTHGNRLILQKTQAILTTYTIYLITRQD